MKIKLYLLELAFIILIFSILIPFLIFTRINIQSLEQISPEISRWGQFIEGGSTTFTEDSRHDVNTITNKAKAIFFKIIIAFITAITLFTFISSIIKSYQWSLITNKKSSKKAWLKLSGILAIWYTIWVTLLLSSVFLLKTGNTIISFSLFIIWFYFTNLLTPTYTKQKEILKTIKNTLRLGTKKVYKLLLPFLLTITSFLIFANIFVVLYHQPIQWFITGWIIFPIFLVWHKIFMFKRIKNLEKNEQ